MKDFSQVWGRSLMVVATLVATAFVAVFTGLDAMAQQTDAPRTALVMPQEPAQPNAP